MKKLVISLAILTTLGAVAGGAIALNSNPRATDITNYQPGHTHESGLTQGAVQHSGGTDRYGCHNASVPYHCH